jgi:ABC-type amino acid transport substrate-binding protein
MATIFKNKYLRVGVDQTTYLDGYRDPRTGQLEGFDIDVARQIAQAIFGNPNDIQFKAITQNQRIPMIESGAVDIVADSVTITCDRKKHVAGGRPHHAGEAAPAAGRDRRVQPAVGRGRRVDRCAARVRRR